MEWVDDAVVIGLRQHGEAAVIVDLLTRERGRHKGYVHGGRSRRLRPVLQPGNGVRASWASRREDSLGTLTLEPLALRAAALMETALSLKAANHICALLRLLPEREPHGLLYAMADAILTHVAEREAAAEALVRLELALLQDLGFGLDLSRCAVTGEAGDLAYVSPRSGRAVSRVAGEPYRDRILVLPAFLGATPEGATPDGAAPTVEALFHGFALTGHFLARDVFRPRGMDDPAGRADYLDALARALRRGSAL